MEMVGVSIFLSSSMIVDSFMTFNSTFFVYDLIFPWFSAIPVFQSVGWVADVELTRLPFIFG